MLRTTVLVVYQTKFHCLFVWPYSDSVRVQVLENGHMEGDCNLELKRYACDINGFVPPISVKIFQKQSYTRLQNILINLNLFWNLTTC
jgi:hypothetical protein